MMVKDHLQRSGEVIDSQIWSKKIKIGGKNNSIAYRSL